MKRAPRGDAAAAPVATDRDVAGDARGENAPVQMRGRAAQPRPTPALRSVAPAVAHRIQTKAAAGASARDLAAEFGAPVPFIAWLLRPRTPRIRLPSPYAADRNFPHEAAYWLGVITARGQLHGVLPRPALVLDLPDAGEGCVGLLTRALVTDHVATEFCWSSLSGLQAYIRDPELCQVLADWGLHGSGRAETSLVFERIPVHEKAVFLRGVLEGAYWGRSSTLPRASTSRENLVVEGAPTFVAKIRDYLAAQDHTTPSTRMHRGRAVIRIAGAGEGALLETLYSAADHRHSARAEGERGRVASPDVG